MRRIVAILLLSCFLFNIIGYKIFFFYQLAEADSRIEARIKVLDESEDGLFTVKIPIRLPYHTDWNEFESVEGEMTYNNTTYRYVKRKVQRDTLILVCIEHHEKSAIEKSSKEYTEKVNDLLPDGSKKQLAKQAKDDFYQKMEGLEIADYVMPNFHSFHPGRVLKTTSYQKDIYRPPSLG